MSEKRFDIAYGGNVITDEDGRDLDLTVKWCVEELVELLNGQQATIEAKNEYQRTLEAKIRRLKNRIKILEKAEGWQN